MGEERTRRRFLEFAGAAAVAGVAGCPAQEGTPTATATPTLDVEAEEIPAGVSREEFVSGPVPEEYRTADSQAGEARILDELRTKRAVRFQEADSAVEAGLAEEGQRCDNCAEYIPDVNGDGFGACAKVEGYIGPDDWCVLWESLEAEREGG